MQIINDRDSPYVRMECAVQGVKGIYKICIIRFYVTLPYEKE